MRKHRSNQIFNNRVDGAHTKKLKCGAHPIAQFTGRDKGAGTSPHLSAHKLYECKRIVAKTIEYVCELIEY